MTELDTTRQIDLFLKPLLATDRDSPFAPQVFLCALLIAHVYQAGREAL